MNFNYDEQIILALYGEVFQKPYGLDKGTKHTDVQSLIYLFKEYNIYDYFNFTWENGVVSEELESVLKELDSKKDYIYSFYNGYNTRRLFVLLGLFTKEQINKIEVFAYAIRKYVEKYNSITPLSNIAYLKKSGLEVPDMENQELKNDTLELLGIFGIINQEIKKLKLNYQK